MRQICSNIEGGSVQNNSPFILIQLKDEQFPWQLKFALKKPLFKKALNYKALNYRPM